MSEDHPQRVSRSVNVKVVKLVFSVPWALSAYHTQTMISVDIFGDAGCGVARLRAVLKANRLASLLSPCAAARVCCVLPFLKQRQ